MGDSSSAIRGSLFGSAFGDALGKRTEFLSVEQIEQRYGTFESLRLVGVPALVTDDTQMALAVADAIMHVSAFTPEQCEPALRTTFVQWLNDPKNDRALGATCLQACENLEHGIRWQDATIIRSKGCGANMRVTPIGCLPHVSATERAALAQFQAALTHAHPTALAAADLTAWTMAFLRQRPTLDEVLAQIRAYVESQHDVYYEAWLDDLWRRSMFHSAQEYINHGWVECLQVLDRVTLAMQEPDRQTDPCLQTGAGWIAEEAFATGLLCFLFFPDEPEKAVQRAAVSSGDSDSIACLAGAFAGAYCGATAWNELWYAQIEYADELEQFVQWCELEQEANVLSQKES